MPRMLQSPTQVGQFGKARPPTGRQDSRQSPERQAIPMARQIIHDLISGERHVALALQAIEPTRAVAHDTRWYEALLRTEGVPTLDVVHLADRDGLGAEVDRVVLDAGLRVLAMSPAIDRLSVNVTPASLQRPDYAEAVKRRLAATGVDPTRVVLEISELFPLMEPPVAMSNLRSLADTGVRWAIDDFGGGQSHLQLLATGVVSVLKLDAGLIEGTAAGRLPKGREVVAGLARLARGLGAEVVVEGVSSEDAESLAAMAGAEWLQGYAIHQPEDAAQLVERLHQAAVAWAA